MRNPRRWIGAGLAVLFLSGSLLAGAAGSFSQSGPGKVHVPASRVGDKLGFVFFAREEAGAEWDRIGQARLSLVEVRTTVDANLTLRDALRIESDVQGGLFVPVSAGGSLGGQPATLSWYTDLSTRRSIRTDQRTGTNFTAGFFELGPTPLSEFRLQGMTLETGREPPPNPDLLGPIHLRMTLSFRFSFPGLLGLAPQTLESLQFLTFTMDPYRNVTISSAVGPIGAIDGRSALPVQQDIRFDAATSKGTVFVRSVLTEWFEEGNPYAVLQHVQSEAVVGENHRKGEAIRVLAEYRPGDGPLVPWGQIPEAVKWERSQRPGLSEDGTDFAHAYPLADALRDVEADPLLFEHRQWRANHPDAVLREAYLGRTRFDRSDLQSPEWYLTFADGPSVHDAKTVRVARFPGTHLASSREAGASSYTDFEPDKLPKRALSAAALQAIWKHAASESYRDEVPNYLFLGLDTSGGSTALDTACLYPSRVPPIPGGFEVPPTHAALVGFVQDSRCTEHSPSWRASLALIDVEKGQMLVLYEYQQPAAQGLVPLVATPHEPTPSGSRPLVPLSASAPVVVGLSTTSLLLLILTLYLLPAAREVAARAFWILGYSKLNRSTVADQRVREQLLEAITADPGVHTSELARRVGVGWGTVVHHLAILERHKLISSHIDGRHRRHFPVGLVDHSRQSQLSALRHDTTRRAYDVVLASPDVTTSHVAASLSVTTAAALWHLRRLHECGLVESQKRGRTVHHRAKPLELRVASVAAA